MEQLPILEREANEPSSNDRVNSGDKSLLLIRSTSPTLKKQIKTKHLNQCVVLKFTGGWKRT
jgi:hypothetical protein